MGWKCLFTQYKVAKGDIFMTVLQKHKFNLAHVHIEYSTDTEFDRNWSD